jgi:hypothetical protein
VVVGGFVIFRRTIHEFDTSFSDGQSASDGEKGTARIVHIQVAAGKPHEELVDTEEQDIREHCRIYSKTIRVDHDQQLEC